MPATEIITPTRAPDPAWDEAFLRVESYLRAYGLESRMLLSQVTAEIIAAARTRAAAADSAVAVALEVTHERIGSWLAQAGSAANWSDERMRAQGRLALVAADLPGRWANHFLGPEPMPAALVEAVAAFEVLPTPEMRVSGMAPEPLEFGLLEPTDPRLPGRRVWLPARAMVSWLLIFGFFGIAWAASR